MQERASRAHTGAIGGDVHVDVAGAGEHRSVHVIVNGHPHLPGRVEEGGRCGMRISWAADVDGATGAAPVIGAALPVFLALEDR